LHAWAREHVESGYQPLEDVLERLRTLEYNNKIDALKISTNIDNELNDVLKAFPSLSSSRATTERNFYVLDQVKRAVYDSDFLYITKTVTYSEGSLAFEQRMNKLNAVANQFSLYLKGEEIARSDHSTLDRLADEIMKLRKSHSSDLKKLTDNVNEQSECIFIIRKKAKAIVQDIKCVKKLEGQCSLCKRFS
jgi:hypothetical protein